MNIKNLAFSTIWASNILRDPHMGIYNINNLLIHTAELIRLNTGKVALAVFTSPTNRHGAQAINESLDTLSVFRDIYALIEHRRDCLAGTIKENALFLKTSRLFTLTTAHAVGLLAFCQKRHILDLGQYALKMGAHSVARFVDADGLSKSASLLAMGGLTIWGIESLYAYKKHAQVENEAPLATREQLYAINLFLTVAEIGLGVFGGSLLRQNVGERLAGNVISGVGLLASLTGCIATVYSAALSSSAERTQKPS